MGQGKKASTLGGSVSKGQGLQLCAVCLQLCSSTACFVPHGVGCSREQERRLEAAIEAKAGSMGNTVSQWLSYHNLGSLPTVPDLGGRAKK